MIEDDLARRFTHHPPTDDQAGRDRAAQHERVRAAGLAFAQLLADLVPDGPERVRALDAVDDAVMRANAGIARPAPATGIRFYSSDPGRIVINRFDS